MPQPILTLGLASLLGGASLLASDAAWAWGGGRAHHGVHVRAHSGAFNPFVARRVFKSHGVYYVFGSHRVPLKHHGHFRHPRPRYHGHRFRFGHFKGQHFGRFTLPRRGFHHARPHTPVAAPARKAVWLPGMWHWNGYGWVWMPGHWARR